MSHLIPFAAIADFEIAKHIKTGKAHLADHVPAARLARKRRKEQLVVV